MEKKEINRIYKELSEKYTDKEISKSFIFPSDNAMTEDEQEALKKSISEHRRKLTDEERQEVVNYIKNDICRIR